MNDPIDLDSMYPPPELDFVGGINFREVGNILSSIIASHCGINADERILDVGCGIGRLAIPITQILTSKGRYDGFDIVADGIKWCKEKISSRYPNFSFQLADVCNDLYNPSGHQTAESYAFPYKNNSFTLVIATSVFTHMLGTPMHNYLKEISRVLEPEGRSFITYYLYTPAAAEGIRKGQSRFKFCVQRDGAWIQENATPESAVCHNLDALKIFYETCGLSIEKIVTSKWWNGSEPTGQDFIVARKIS